MSFCPFPPGTRVEVQLVKGPGKRLGFTSMCGTVRRVIFHTAFVEMDVPQSVAFYTDPNFRLTRYNSKSNLIKVYDDGSTQGGNIVRVLSPNDPGYYPKPWKEVIPNYHDLRLNR